MPIWLQDGGSYKHWIRLSRNQVWSKWLTKPCTYHGIKSSKQSFGSNLIPSSYLQTNHLRNEEIEELKTFVGHLFWVLKPVVIGMWFSLDSVLILQKVHFDLMHSKMIIFLLSLTFNHHYLNFNKMILQLQYFF